MDSIKWQSLGNLLEVANCTHLKNTSGVYRLRCTQCSSVLYVGKARKLIVRLLQHTFCPPYGAVDIVLGEVLNANGRKKWEQLCEHLKKLSRTTRVEVARGLLVDVVVPENPAEIGILEKRLLSESAATFGNGRRIWGSRHPDDFTDYWVKRAGGCLSADDVLD